MVATKSRVIENVPALQWGRGRECTFLGALEAALSVTPHPCSYVELMGFTALAFRTRWWVAIGNIRWCPSCAVGEMDEELRAADRGCGWQLRVKLLWSDAEREAAAGEIIRSIDGGIPVLAYDGSCNMGVAFGYSDDGRSVLMHKYRQPSDPPEPSVIAPAKLGWMWVLPGEHREPPPRDLLVRDALRAAVMNFQRGTGTSGPGAYWYGPAAIEHWAGDLAAAGSFTADEQQKLMFVSWWNFVTLVDARRAAVEFLARHAATLALDDQPHVAAARSAYEEQVRLFDQFSNYKQAFARPDAERATGHWPPAARQREVDLLHRVLEVERRAIEALSQISG